MSLWTEAKEWKITCAQCATGFHLDIEARCYSQESLAVLISILTLLMPILPKKPVPMPLAASAYREEVEIQCAS